MKYKKELVLILLIALLLRFAPVIIYHMPIGYDTPYHERSALAILSSKEIPKTDFGFEERPNIYPPMYSLFLAELCLLSPFSVNFLGMILLPFIASLLCLSVFVLLKRIAGEKKAIIAALFIAITSPLISASFDSPEVFVFFFIPIALLLIWHKKELFGSLLFAFGLLWNYLIIVFAFPAFLFAYRKNKKVLAFGVLGIVLAVLFYLYSDGISIILKQHLSAGDAFVAFNLRNFLPAVLVIVLLFVVPAVLLSRKKSIIPEQKFFRNLLYLSTFALLSFIATNYLRPWEQVKFVAFATVCLICGIAWSKNTKRFLAFCGTFLLLYSLLLSFHSLYPRITITDINAINYLEKIEMKQEGNIIAEPSFAEHIRIRKPDLSQKIMTSLYFETSGEDSVLGKSLELLSTQEIKDKEFFQNAGFRYLITNFEDEGVRGTQKIEQNSEFNKVYELQYYHPCPFWFMPKYLGFACYENKTKIFEYNEFKGLN